MPLQNTHVIDLIAQDPTTSTVVLGMTEPRPWEGGDQQLFELQEKVNAYLSFALDGEMHEHFPQFRNQSLRLELVCTTEPDPRTAHFVGLVREQIGFQGIEFLVKVNPELASAAEGGNCASGSCGCKGDPSDPQPIAQDVQTHGGGGGCCGGGGHDHDHSHGHAHSHEGGCCGGGSDHQHDHSHSQSHAHSHSHDPNNSNGGCCGGHAHDSHGTNGH